MKWNEIDHDWPALKRKVSERFDGLSPEELEKTQGGRRQLLQLIEATYGKADPKAEQDLDEIIKGDDNG